MLVSVFDGILQRFIFLGCGKDRLLRKGSVLHGSQEDLSVDGIYIAIDRYLA